jgi:hypothetical protein
MSNNPFFEFTQFGLKFSHSTLFQLSPSPMSLYTTSFKHHILTQYQPNCSGSGFEALAKQFGIKSKAEDTQSKIGIIVGMVLLNLWKRNLELADLPYSVVKRSANT